MKETKNNLELEDNESTNKGKSNIIIITYPKPSLKEKKKYTLMKMICNLVHNVTNSTFLSEIH